MQCPNCGNAVKPESKFCPRCAFNLRQAAQPPVEKAPERQPDSFEKKWEQAAQQYGQPAARQPEPPAVGRQPEAQMAQTCPRCSAPVKPGQKFCMNCAAPLGEGAPAQPFQPAQMQGQAPPMPAYPPQMQPQGWGDQQAYQVAQPARSNKTMIIAIVVGVLVLAGAGVGAYFLFLKDKGAAGNTNGQANQSAVTGNSNRQASASNTNARTTTIPNPTTAGADLQGSVNGVLQALKEGNAETLKSYMARSAGRTADEIMSEVRAKGEMKGYKVLTEPASFENRGVASYTIDWANGGQSTALMNFVNEGGAWKLDTFFIY